MMSRDLQETVYDYGSASDWWVYDPQTNADIKSFSSEADGLTADRLSQEMVADKASHLISYYGPSRRTQAGEFLPTLMFEHVGEYSFHIDVFDGNDVIFRATTSIDIIVKAQPIQKFELEWSRHRGDCDPLTLNYPLGYALPAFTLSFLDAAGNLVRERKRHVMVHISSAQCLCEVKALTGEIMMNENNEEIEGYRLMEKPLYEFVWEDNGKIYFDECTFFTRPKEPGMIPSRGYKDVKWTIHVYLAEEGTELGDLTSQVDQLQTTTPLGSQTFTIRYIPTVPLKLRLLEPAEQPIVVENEAILPQMRLVAEDAWGNRCNTTGFNQVWKVQLGENEYVGGLSEGDTEQSIDSNGEISFSHLTANYDGILSPEGTEQGLDLLITRMKLNGSKLDPEKDKEWITLQHPLASRNGLIKTENHLGATIPIILKPRQFPYDIEVLYEGRPCQAPGDLRQDLPSKICHSV